MSRVITPESGSKDRTQYQRAIVLALRELMGQPEIDRNTYDIAAFVTLMLEAIDLSIDQSGLAWEKRGYWLKADRFRQEWRWAGELGKRMKDSLLGENWDDVRTVAAILLTKLNKVNLPIRHRLGTPWVGAWGKLARK